MADQEENPTLPAMGTDKKPGGRPSKAELDAREAALDEREEAMMARMDAMEARLAEWDDLPRVSADEGIQKEHSHRNTKSIRKPVERGLKFPDIEPYLEKYGHECQLFYVNNLNGDVQRWIDHGAEPVPVMQKQERVFEGITDKADSQWVRVVGGSDGEGNYFHVYLLMISHELYDELKLSPIRERQELIRQAMRARAGHDASDYTDGPRLPTYAPNLPSGQTGFEETRETVGSPA